MAFKTNKQIFPGVVATYGRISKVGNFSGNINNNRILFAFEWFMSRELSISKPDTPVYSIDFDMPFEPLMALIIGNPTNSITGCIYAVLNSLDPTIEANAAYLGTQFFGLDAILEEGQTMLKL